MSRDTPVMLTLLVHLFCNATSGIFDTPYPFVRVMLGRGKRLFCCVGDAPPDAWLARRPVLPVSGAAEPVGLPAGHQHPASSEWSRPERLSEEPGHREDDRVDDRDDDVPREFVRQL